MRSIEWKTVPIRELYEGLYDGPHATPKPADFGPVFLGIKNVTDDGQLDLSEIRNIAEEDFAKWTKRVEPRAGDLVFTYEATLNRYAIIPDGFRGCLGRRMALIRPNPKELDVRYLLYYFFTDAWRAVIRKNTLTGATVDRIPLTTFPEFPVCVPPLSKQRKIAAALSAYDELIENNQRRIRILEEMARSLYREWFVHFRFPSHDNHPRVPSSLGEIPQGWEVKRISDLGNVVTGKTPSKLVQEYFGKDVPFVKTPDMHGNTFLLATGEQLSQAGANSQANKTIPAGSICVSCIGTIGVVSITTEECQTNQQINSIILDDEIYRYFLYFRLKDAKQELENLGSNGATMCNVNKGKFEAIELIVPPGKNLKHYHEIASRLLSQILVLARQSYNLRRTRDLLLPRLLSGQIELEAD